MTRTRDMIEKGDRVYIKDIKKKGIIIDDKSCNFFDVAYLEDSNYIITYISKDSKYIKLLDKRPVLKLEESTVKRYIDWVNHKKPLYPTMMYILDIRKMTLENITINRGYFNKNGFSNVHFINTTLNDGEFIKCNLMASTKISNTKFNDIKFDEVSFYCKFKRSEFDKCTFNKSIFHKNINGTKFSKCVFRDVKFTDISDCTFIDSVFINCKFPIKTSFSVIFDNASFYSEDIIKNASFGKISFKNMSLSRDIINSIKYDEIYMEHVFVVNRDN